MKILLTNNITINNIDFYDFTEKQLNNKIFSHIQNLKNTLNVTKNCLDEYSISKSAKSKLLSNFNVFKYEKYKLAKNINANNITNAWLKCYETISEFNLINSSFKEIYHFDNASLPGSFILATHHYMKTLYNSTPYIWKASSMIEKDSNNYLSDDYSLYKNYPENWIMDENNNGDITNIDNIDDIINKININGKKVNLYTSDLGFDISQDYNNQEQLHIKANIGQILLCINLLKYGGNCVIKHYTTFELSTLSYLCIFSKLFKYCYIYKPITSKSSNSEVYIIGINFMNRQVNNTNNVKFKKENQLMCLEKLNYILRKYMMVNLLDKSFIEYDTLCNFISYILPLLYKITKNQIDKLLLINNMLSNLKNDFDDLSFCKNVIYKSLDKRDIKKFYEICVFSKIKIKDKLNITKVYN